MLRYPSPILPNLWLGSCDDARLLADTKSDHVFVSCASEVSLFHMEGLKIDLHDCTNEHLFDMLDEAADFINGHIRDRKILVYCRMGKSRSPTVIIYFLMKYRSYTFEDALRLVKSKRGIICLNDYFVRELINYQNSKELADLLC
jgi:hypothetical protein